MALTVKFWTFSKKENSTAIPTGAAAQTLSCVLKSDSGILSPVLEIGLGMSFNPYNLNYAQITNYNRYYRVTDWQWSSGLWLCSLDSDPLATFKTEIGSAFKYVLRAASDENKSIIDTEYPSLARKTYTKTTESLSFGQTLLNGIFILGIISHSSSAYGSVGYFGVNAAELSALSSLMFPVPTDSWSTAFQGVTDTIIRSIYDPFQYLVSCRWFPVYDASAFGSATSLSFGNYNTAITGYPLLSFGYFPELNFNMALPTGWVNKPARERCAPYAAIHFHLEPFGDIELPADRITDYSSLSCYLNIDYISGKSRLQIYCGTSRANGHLIYEGIAQLASEIQLTAAYVRLQDALRAASGLAGRIAAGGEAGLGIPGAALDFASAAGQHTISTVGMNDGFSFLDGIATLLVEEPIFPAENVIEFGRPLYAVRTLGALSGFIKCADADIDLPGFEEEVRRVGEYLTGGFYYE